MLKKSIVKQESSKNKIEAHMMKGPTSKAANFDAASYSASLRRLKELLQFKNSFTQIFDLYDELTAKARALNIVSNAFVILVNIPVFIVLLNLNYAALGFLLFAFALYVFVILMNLRFKPLVLVKKIESLDNEEFKLACFNKYASILRFFKMFIPELSIWKLIVSYELQEELRKLQRFTVSPLIKYVDTFADKEQFLDYVKSREALTEDDVHFLRTVLVQKHMLKKVFNID